MQKRAVRVLAVAVLLSSGVAVSATASSRSSGRPVSPLTRLLIYIHSRLGPPFGIPSPEPAADTTDSPRVTQPKG